MTCPFKPMCRDMYERSSCRTIGHAEWCGIHCSGEGCGDCSCRAYEPFKVEPRRLDLWNTRTTSSGRFEDAKKSGDVFYGARREDRGSLCDVWGALDSLHRSLLLLLGIAVTGLILHSFGVFVR